MRDGVGEGGRVRDAGRRPLESARHFARNTARQCARFGSVFRGVFPSPSESHFGPKRAVPQSIAGSGLEAFQGSARSFPASTPLQLRRDRATRASDRGLRAPGLDENDPALRDLHPDLKLAHGLIDARDVAQGSDSPVDEQMEPADARAVELERKPDGTRVLPGASPPVGNPPFDLIPARSLPETGSVTQSCAPRARMGSSASVDSADTGARLNGPGRASGRDTLDGPFRARGQGRPRRVGWYRQPVRKR
jgi:hypothetical protein